MTDVYQSVDTTNEVEDKYAKNDVARKAILGPLSIVVKCIGFDETFSLFKKEIRGRCISWIATPLSIVGFVFLFMNVFEKIHKIENALSWHWGELLLLTFLAVQSLAAAAFLASRTRSLFFLSFYDSWKECARLAEENKEEKAEEGKENGGADAECGVAPCPIPRGNSGRSMLVLFAFLFFAGASVATSAKYALNHGNNPKPNETATGLLLDQVFAFEPLTSLWASVITATALSVYGVLHGIMKDTIDDFNKDLQTASESGSLSSRLDTFALRHQSILVFARLLSSKMGTFATFGTKTSIVVNFAAMFLSLAFKPETGPLALVCVILWTFLAIGAMVCILLQPAEVQNKLNETCEILIADKHIWAGDLATAQQASIMLTKKKYTDTTVSVFKCLKLTPWVANGLMVVPPIIGGTITCMKMYL